MRVQFNGAMNVGSATAISRDGYFLTAGHCAKTEPIHMLFRNGLNRSELGMLKARVVWTGTDDLDLALLHVSVQLDEYFELACNTEPVSGDRIFSMGYPEGKSSLTEDALVGVRKLHEHSENGDWRIFIHNAPLYQGDSGGAVFDSQGRLLAINYSTEAKVFRWMRQDFVLNSRQKAIMPDPQKNTKINREKSRPSIS